MDEMTLALGMQYSTLGYLHHHPDEKPRTSGSKGKEKMKAGAGGAGPKINAPRKVLKGLEALTARDKSYLEQFLDQQGTLKPMVEALKKNLAQPVDPSQAAEVEVSQLYSRWARHY